MESWRKEELWTRERPFGSVPIVDDRNDRNDRNEEAAEDTCGRWWEAAMVAKTGGIR